MILGVRTITILDHMANVCLWDVVKPMHKIQILAFVPEVDLPKLVASETTFAVRGCANFQTYFPVKHVDNTTNVSLLGGNNCLNVVGTWVSRYNYHGSYGEIDQGFSKLAAKGVNRVYFNIWADGNLYAQSNTASSNGE